MAGKPNFPSDVEERSELLGAADPTPGLSALDQERAASLADEGGWAGAVKEGQDREARDRVLQDRRAQIPAPARPTPDRRLGWVLAAGAVFVAAILFFGRRS